jgi:hypothetical protein
MRENAVSPSDKKHIRDSWIWAIVIIAVGVLCTVGDMFAQVEVSKLLS